MFLNRSFARRIGKSLSTLQKDLLKSYLPKYLFSNDVLLNQSKDIFLEIGFGMGEHFISQAKENPESLFIGAEVYLNGVANVLKLAKEKEVSNFLLWPNDIDLMLLNLPNDIIKGIYILFPDPWPKRNQRKRRIFNKERLEILRNKLQVDGFLVFASDIEDYFESSKRLICEDNFRLLDERYITPHHGYIATKYHMKALDENRVARFITAYKTS